MTHFIFILILIGSLASLNVLALLSIVTDMVLVLGFAAVVTSLCFVGSVKCCYVVVSHTVPVLRWYDCTDTEKKQQKHNNVQLSQCERHPTCYIHHNLMTPVITPSTVSLCIYGWTYTAHKCAYYAIFNNYSILNYQHSTVVADDICLIFPHNSQIHVCNFATLLSSPSKHLHTCMSFSFC